MKYGKNFGCRHGLPHDTKIIHETPSVKHETCIRCNKKFRWNKGYKGRVQNAEYLKAHVRNFAQRMGATKRIYNRLYNPDKLIIKL